MTKKITHQLLIIFLFVQNFLFGWVYPEHRDIALLAVKNLDSKNRELLNNLWAEARKGNEHRLTYDVIEPYQFRDPSHLDFASWPAISADHSCSAKNMLDVVLNSNWILEVADIAAKLKIDLKQYGTKDARITDNALRDADILLQRADPEYATRAGTNNVHFLLSLKEVSVEEIQYGHQCIKEGVELNAIGAYAWFHYSALLKIGKLTTENLSQEERSSLVLSALADEAFALHFLEDVFAAGHVAGTWGNASQRKGTHDYYNKSGLRTSTWEGENIILTGDAYMREEDAIRAALAVKLSLEQFINASEGKTQNLFNQNKIGLFSPDSFNVCKINYMPYRDFDNNYFFLLEKIISQTPIPGLVSGIGELPRFKAELGFFAGIAPSSHGSLISGGFGENQETLGVIGGLEASIRLGLGLDGVLNESGDGLIYLSVGWREDGSSSTGVVEIPGIEKYGSLLSAIPGRSAYSARLRLPFYLIPGDLLILGPILFFTSPNTIANMAVVAANGGLIPWHSGIATSVGRFQFVLGREIGVYLYGRNKARDALFLIGGDYGEAVVSYRSTQLEFPFLEFRPTRSFATNQSSTLLFQFYGGIDFPHNISVLETTGIIEKPKMDNIWFWGLRMTFDWRHYF
ncbi:MAG: hypothetical protein H6612_03820 [Ignavibacteriales bacterium]|nr:hypothetical protein [Ignavibacteriales bacterium]MCB9258459.1 hypothetical protein [Ignavibacteriales bacterium]